MTRKQSDYDVGFGKPPKHSRFKKGNTASRGPRKKRAPPNLDAALEMSANQLMAVKVKGRVAKMPALDAIIYGIRNEALQGNDRSRRLYLSLIGNRNIAGIPKSERDVFAASFSGAREKLKVKLDEAAAARARQAEQNKDK